MSEIHRWKALRSAVEHLEGAHPDDPESPFIGEEVVSRADVLAAIDLFAQSAVLDAANQGDTER